MTRTFHAALAALFLSMGVASAPALALQQGTVETIDPNQALDNQPGYDDAPYSQPTGEQQSYPSYPAAPSAQASGSTGGSWSDSWESPSTVSDPAAQSDINSDIAAPAAAPSGAQNGYAATADEATYQEDDLIGAAEGVFGKGARGLAKMIEDILREQGQPNGYIVGREAGGAFVLGVRYGSGKLHHKVEGERTVYWTGPSIGIDAGGNAGSTFVLVYNLYNTEDIYRRFPAGEGAAYLVGGFNASYLRSGDTVLIPIRMGAGLRLGANIGYMKFSKKQRWLPF